VKGDGRFLLRDSTGKKKRKGRGRDVSNQAIERANSDPSALEKAPIPNLVTRVWVPSQARDGKKGGKKEKKTRFPGHSKKKNAAQIRREKGSPSLHTLEGKYHGGEQVRKEIGSRGGEGGEGKERRATKIHGEKGEILLLDRDEKKKKENHDNDKD